MSRSARLLASLLLSNSQRSLYCRIVQAQHRLSLLVITADDMIADSDGWNGNVLGATPTRPSGPKRAGPTQ